MRSWTRQVKNHKKIPLQAWKQCKGIVATERNKQRQGRSTLAEIKRQGRIDHGNNQSRNNRIPINRRLYNLSNHKKGTLHLTFLDENILRRFNVAACMGKGWLPGDYGAKPFKDMSPQEQEVAESFEVGGEAQYSANVGQKMFDAILGTIKLLEAA